jgi:arylsulfatase A-like enzyme
VKRFASQRNRRGYLYFPLHLPHDPYHRPNSDLYDTGRWVLGSQVAPNQSDVAAIMPYGKAMLEAADTLAYRVFNAIPDWLKDETVVLLHSDNGSDTRVLSSESYPAGLGGGAYVGGHGKRSAFDPGIRTPAYVYSQNTNLVVAPGRVVNQNTMQSLDWYATTLEFFGVPWKEIVAKRFGGKGVSPADRSISQLSTFQTNTTKFSRAYAKGGIFTPNGFNRGKSPGTRWITDGTNKLTWAAGSTAFSASKLYNIVNNPRETAVESEPAGGAAARKALQAQWDSFYSSMPNSY